jgi:hypothetical protein
MDKEHIDDLPEVPASGDNAEDLLSFIENETPEDVYLREKRDLDIEIMLYKQHIEEHMRVIFSINLLLEKIDEFHKKYIDGSSKEDNVY